MDKDVAVDIEKLDIQTTKNLDALTKKQLVDLLNKEFSNKQSFFSKIAEAEREKILEKYRKDSDFFKKKKKMEVAHEAFIKAGSDLAKTGLDDDGNIIQHYNRGSKRSEDEKAADKVTELLETVKNAGPTENFKNKLIARLWLASTYGEAMVIVRQIMGNGLLPALTQKQLTVK